tara:strand:+ start:70 stop:384 length:315 start_codon:yes stop_codon:yes gene_type:complete
MEIMDYVEATGIGAVGDLVKVVWLDAAQQIKVHTLNAKNPSEHLALCETIGELVIEDDKALILVQHWSDTDGIDIMSIPKDWCQKIDILREKECISENSESPPE